MRNALVAAWAFVSLAAAPAARAERWFDYIHVEADSGASSGGHAAVRFGDEVFHFQQADPGIVRVAREPFDYFEYVYRAVGNRGLDVTRIRAPEHAYETLREAFERRHVTQEAHLEALASAHRDRTLLEYLAAPSGADGARRSAKSPVLRLRATGYFFGPDDPDISPGEVVLRDALRSGARDALSALRRDIAQARGADYLDRRAVALDGEIAGLRFDCTPAIDVVANEIPAAVPAFADEYAQMLVGRLAIDVLQTAPEPVTEAFRVVAGRRLGTEELVALRDRASDAARDVVRLLGSKRRDWGFAVMVKTARLVATLTSIRLERLVVPDVYAREAHAVAIDALAARPRLARAVLDERRADFAEARRAALDRNASDETSWSRMELTANLWLELREGLSGATAVRIHEGAPLPVREAPFDGRWPMPAIDTASAVSAAVCARDREAKLRARLRSVYRYDVVTRNCVTEIFDTIDGAADAEPDAREVSLPRGGTVGDVSLRAEPAHSHSGAGGLPNRLDARSGLNFVPFVSADAVNRSFEVSQRIYLPSYRRYWLERCNAIGCNVRTRLRETNTFTSALYEPSRRQEVFLFFTDTAPALRPVAGAANLVAGTGATLAGVFTLPFDRGALLRAGLRSTAFSLPELAFVNIRKGSNLLVPRDWTRTSPFESGAFLNDRTPRPARLSKPPLRRRWS